MTKAEIIGEVREVATSLRGVVAKTTEQVNFLEQNVVRQVELRDELDSLNGVADRLEALCDKNAPDANVETTLATEVNGATALPTSPDANGTVLTAPADGVVKEPVAGEGATLAAEPPAADVQPEVGGDVVEPKSRKK